MSSALQPLPVVNDPRAPSPRDAAMSGRASGVTMPSGFTARERLQARRLVVVMMITAAFFVAQLAGAIWAESNVLQIEAVHVLTDVAALGLAAIAMRVAVRRPTARFTFGLRRVEPVTAIFNALLVLVATVLLVWEAIVDLAGQSEGPHADRMLYVAAGALVVNGISAWLIHGAIGAGDHGDAHTHGGHAHGHAPGRAAHDERRGQRPVAAVRVHEDEHVHVHEDVHGRHDHGENARTHHVHVLAPADEPCAAYDHHHIAHHTHRGRGHALNLRGAWLHLFGDALGSLAAIIAAIAIRLGASPKVDPIASFVVAGILVYGGVRLLHDAVLVLLEASPPHLAVEEVRAAILATDGVAELHDLHVWTLGAGHDAITAHVSAHRADPSLAARVEGALRQRFPVEYVTIQVEVGGVTCQADAVEP
jgi:cation diffusion facilitator family transporter